MDNKKRCKWCNLKNPKYIEYHDNEWCKTNFDDKYLYEMLILESFQAGLSWECVLNKRENFRKAYDKFDLEKVCSYDNKKIIELLNNKEIIRNKLKINASINNSKIFKEIVEEYGTFHNYLKSFTHDKILYEVDKTTNDLSDNISSDLQKRGMKFVGSTIIYSYLQAIGIIYSHDRECYLYKKFNLCLIEDDFPTYMINNYIDNIKKHIDCKEYNYAFTIYSSLICALCDSKIEISTTKLIDLYSKIGIFARISYRKGNDELKSYINNWINQFAEKNYNDDVYLEDLLLSIR